MSDVAARAALAQERTVAEWVKEGGNGGGNGSGKEGGKGGGSMPGDLRSSGAMAGSTYSVLDFLNSELVLYSHACNYRSLPSSLDGLKASQRKILFTCFERNLQREKKVADLSGLVSGRTAYKHGEDSLHKTIVAMAQDYTGSNNVPLLMPRGQFGTRASGGKDSASARYLNTMLQPVARAMFRKSDEDLLTYVSPSFYIGPSSVQ